MIPQPFVFGYFPRNKYKDLVFYVKDDNGMNCGLIEMPDTEENRALMEALSSHNTPTPASEPVPDTKYYFDAGWQKGYEQALRERGDVPS